MRVSVDESCQIGNTNLFAILPRIAALLLVVASIGFGSVFAFSQASHHGWLLAGLAVAMAIGLELAKPLAVVGAVRSLGAWDIARGAGLAVLAVVAIGYSLTAELQLMSVSRAGAVSARTAELNADTLQRRAEIKGELDSITPRPRSTGELAPLVADAKRKAGDCGRTGTRTQREGCKMLPGLQSELARAERVEALNARVTALESRPEAVRASREIDPGSATLATFLALLFGLRIEPATLSDLLVLVGVLALEVGSATSGLLVTNQSGRSALVHVQQPSAGATVVHKPTMPATVTGPSAIIPVVQRQPEPISEPNSTVVDQGCIRSAEARSAAEAAIVDQLKSDGGKTVQSERKLASKVGASRSTARRALHSLMAAGMVAKVGEQLVLRS